MKKAILVNFLIFVILLCIHTNVFADAVSPSIENAVVSNPNGATYYYIYYSDFTLEWIFEPRGTLDFGTEITVDGYEEEFNNAYYHTFLVPDTGNYYHISSNDITISNHSNSTTAIVIVILIIIALIITLILVLIKTRREK